MGVGVEPKAERQRAGGLARRGRAPAMIGLPDGEDSGVTDLGSGGQEGPCAREVPRSPPHHRRAENAGAGCARRFGAGRRKEEISTGPQQRAIYSGDASVDDVRDRPAATSSMGEERELTTWSVISTSADLRRRPSDGQDSQFASNPAGAAPANAAVGAVMSRVWVAVLGAVGLVCAGLRLPVSAVAEPVVATARRCCVWSTVTLSTPATMFAGECGCWALIRRRPRFRRGRTTKCLLMRLCRVWCFALDRLSA